MFSKAATFDNVLNFTTIPECGVTLNIGRDMLADPWLCSIEELLLLLVKLASLSDFKFLVDKLSAGNVFKD